MSNTPAKNSQPTRTRSSNNDWRKQIFDIIEPLSKKHKASKLYDRAMIIITLISFVPLMFHEESLWLLSFINIVCAIIFIIDYICRFITADYLFGDHSIKSFIKYPFSIMAIMDLIVILSLITGTNNSLRLLRISRLLHVVRIFQHSRSLQLITIVLKRAKRPLLFVISLASIYIFIVAAIMFNEETNLFPNFLDALYWAIISLSTIGFGDIVPTTEIGRAITAISALVGIAVFALPTSVITAEYVAVVNEYREGKIDGKHHPRRFELEETELIIDAMDDTEKDKK